MFSVPPSGRHTDVLVTPLTVCLREAKNSECQPADTPRAFQSKRILRWPVCVEPKNSKCQPAGNRDGGGRSVHSSGVLLRDVVCLKTYTRRRATEHKRRVEPTAARGTCRRFRSMPVFNRDFYGDHSNKTPCHWATLDDIPVVKQGLSGQKLPCTSQNGLCLWEGWLATKKGGARENRMIGGGSRRTRDDRM